VSAVIAARQLLAHSVSYEGFQHLAAEHPDDHVVLAFMPALTTEGLGDAKVVSAPFLMHDIIDHMAGRFAGAPRVVIVTSAMITPLVMHNGAITHVDPMHGLMVVSVTADEVDRAFIDHTDHVHALGPVMNEDRPHLFTNLLSES